MIRHALVQFKPFKSDHTGTISHLSEVLAELKEARTDVDVIALPEAALSGYFLQGGTREQALRPDELVAIFQDTLAAIGWRRPVDVCVGAFERGQEAIYNSAFYLELNTPAAGVRHIHRKVFLPTYGIFDEARFVSRGSAFDAFETRFGRAAMLVCEDAWHTSTAAILALKGAEILYIPAASPVRELHGDVPANARRWRSTVEGIAAEHGIFVISTGLVGFEGGKGLTGYSSVIDPFGEVLALGSLFDEEVLLVDVDPEAIAVARYENPLLFDLRNNLSVLQSAFEHAGAAPLRDGT